MVNTKGYLAVTARNKHHRCKFQLLPIFCRWGWRGLTDMECVVGWPRSAAEYPHNCSLSPSTTSRTGQRIGRTKAKFVSRDTDSLVSEGKRKKKTTNRKPLNISYKQITIQPVSEQLPPKKSVPSSLLLPLLQSVLLRTMSYGMEDPFGQFRWVVPPVSPSSVSPSLLTAGQSGKERKPWCCASIKQQLNHCVLLALF